MSTQKHRPFSDTRKARLFGHNDSVISSYKRFICSRSAAGDLFNRDSDVAMSDTCIDVDSAMPLIALSQKDKGKGRAKPPVSLPETIWRRIFECFYDNVAYDVTHGNRVLHTTAPLQISREIATFSAEAMYRHPHITYRAFERFIGSLKSSFRHGTVGPLSKAKMVRHLTIFPSPPVPASAHSQYGETHKASATKKDTIHQFLPELLRSFTSLDSLTVRDALFTTWKDWVTFQKALSQVKPQKAQLELSLWDLTHSASGLELRAATTHSVHADFNNDVFVSHKDIEDTLDRDRPFSSPAIPHFQVMLETWKAALTSGGEMIMPLHWIDPKRKTPDPTPETAPVVSLGGTSNSDDESDVAEPRTMVDITPNPDMEDYEIIIPASAVNRLRAYTAGWSSTGTSLNTFRTSFASPASGIDDQAGSSAIDMSDYLPLPFTGVPGVTLEWGALRMRRGDPVVEVALSAYQFIANTGFAAESGSSAIQQATTWASGSSLTLDDATISAIPIREEGEDMDWSDEFGYLYGILGEGSLNTPFLEPQVVPSAPDVPTQESFVVLHDWAGISGMDQSFPDSTSLFTTSPLFNPPPPAHGSQRLALAYTSAVHPGSTRTRTALASSTPTPSPGSGDYAHEARAGLLQLLKGWSPRLQALSLVLLDPAAGIMVRAPDLDFWRELDIPHIRVRLPRGCTALSVLQGSSEYRRSLRRRQELVGHFNRDPYAGVSTVTGPAHNGHANHNNFGAFLLSLASNTLTTQETELRQSKDTGTEQTVYIGHGVLHPNNLLFEIEVNTHAEMQDEMWYECGGQIPSQVCRLLVGEQDWRDVDITRAASHTPIISRYPGSYFECGSPATSAFPSPTFSFASFCDDDISEMSDGEDMEPSAAVGDTYNAAAARAQQLAIRARNAIRA